jgi:hypothetical protein
MKLKYVLEGMTDEIKNIKRIEFFGKKATVGLGHYSTK